MYVADPDNFRIEKFDSAGNFVLEFGEVGSGPGQLQTGQYGANLGVAPDGTVYILEKDRVQAFEPDGTFKAAIPLVGDLEVLKNRNTQALAVDDADNIYATASQAGGILKFNSLGGLVTPDAFPAPSPGPLAVDDAGNVYTTKAFQEVVEFDSAGDFVIPPESGFADVGLILTGLATGDACGIEGHDLYVVATNGTTVGSITAYGPPPDPDICPPPSKPPTVSAQFAASATSESAALRARINPHFWPDATYYVEYGAAKCSEGGCTSRQPLTDQLLGEKVVDRALTTKTVSLPGLQPSTEYHFRFVAESGGGGPVFGIDPDGDGPIEPTESEGREGSFTTFSISSPPAEPCLNAAFRSGPSALLADCRAYEMVSPLDKGGGEIFALSNSRNDRASLNQASPDGDAVTYSSFRSFGEAAGAPATSQYRAARTSSGWITANISPPRGTPHQAVGGTLESQYQFFSDDLCGGWLVHDTNPPLTQDGVPTFPNLYKADVCSSPPAYEALTTVAPPNQKPGDYNLDVQGISADGSHTVFRAAGKLTTDAAEGLNNQCYEYFEGALRLVSVLPIGQPNPSNCSIGTATVGAQHIGGGNIRRAQVHNAISEDGSRIYWTATTGFFGAGKLYLRSNGKNPTLFISQQGEQLSSQPSAAQFLTASADGSKVIFSVGTLRTGDADIYEYRLSDKSTHLIVPEARGFLGAGEDARLLYLVSEAVRGGPNEEGKTPVPGKPNLYLYDAGGEVFSFIGQLSADDAKSESFTGRSPLAMEMNQRTSRVSADGQVAAFMSTQPLTGFDNTDANSAEPDAEVFRYEAEGDGGNGQLTCVSCNPTGIAPSGRELFGGAEGLQPFELWAAAKLTPWQTQLNAPRVLPDEGNRVFFESFEGLVPRDRNGKQDVYQWAAPGAGSCTEGSPTYSPPNDGCLDLISSGQSPLDAAFLDASADGRDAFFTTAASLVAQDPGLVDVYDAREGGGFPIPPPPQEPCQGEACQSAGSAPADVTPASQAVTGGNVKPKKARRCPKGKVRVSVKGRKRCVKRHSKHATRHSNHRKASR